MLKVVEAFSGIGAQKQALEKINIEHEIVNTIEWDINAIYAYDIMHHEDNSPSKLSKDKILERLANVTLSPDGKKPFSKQGLHRLKEEKLKKLYAAIDRNNNLCDITQVTGDMIPNDIDLLTYSFPCQDLSIGSAWYNNDNDGIKKGAKTRSGLLWEIERILKERTEMNAPLPKFLLMENVNAITSPKHNPNFVQWQEELRMMGYTNKVYKGLNALNFGIPQSRSRTFMLSIRNSKIEPEEISNLDYNIESSLADYLRFDCTEEADAATPNYTPSRKKIYDKNRLLAENGVIKARFTNTISTKQDRNPNAGVILQNDRMRYLTPRETFLLMGFPEYKFEKLIRFNRNDSYFANSHLYRMSGNSIAVDVLTRIFQEIDRLKGIYFDE
ncbi:DNA (cytosine-5-)-methyltransferase [Enterococcus durans]|uniref:DNA (cytosine-5-)-methyltransferase n=1 Tax=Enterococcus durans TaxID=53345 RepID=UPI0018844106|nr:DNA (cytosine-5-)-methyltransferase [Enterococcus durans]MBE9888459.1 DNA (cytosine-5-)-methyltransferase [Enterococcus durans]